MVLTPKRTIIRAQNLESFLSSCGGSKNILIADDSKSPKMGNTSPEPIEPNEPKSKNGISGLFKEASRGRANECLDDDPMLVDLRVDILWLEDLLRVRSRTAKGSVFCGSVDLLLLMLGCLDPSCMRTSGVRGKQNRLLAYEPDFPSDPLQIQALQIQAVDQNLTSIRIVKPLNQTDNSRFPTPTLAHQCSSFPTGHVQTKARKYLHFGPGWIPEVNILQLNFANHILQHSPFGLGRVYFGPAFDGLEHLVGCGPARCKCIHAWRSLAECPMIMLTQAAAATRTGIVENRTIASRHPLTKARRKPPKKVDIF
ncbi:L-ribulose-5-phosphate 3-epimerase UlaE [Striga asiatica]|uniref:L-ribulose-5-phosphate 3-epimerase UlaE n=1 Tax=Striga asiatica TaxID=4170 RepID=A0A5A7NVC1_STRAF|nr:L-ribulose-5-phosphate 3-epimerase UlaE [Striga asiatica]